MSAVRASSGSCRQWQTLSRKAPIKTPPNLHAPCARTRKPCARTRKLPVKLSKGVTGGRARAIGSGESHQSSSTGDAALLHKTAGNASADETRSAPRLIPTPRQAVNPPHLPPPPQHCWLRCWSGVGGPAPTPAVARACATAPSPSSVRSRRSGAPMTIFAKTGPEILIFRKSSCHQGCHRTRSQSISSKF